MSPISVKICGINNEAAAQAAIEAGADYAGFVYFPASPRHVELARAHALKSLLPASIKSVSVLVDPSDELLDQVHTVLQPDYIQLHGKETPERFATIRRRYPALKLIKAIRVSNADDIAMSAAFSAYADKLLFDAKPSQLPNVLPGGNGLAFDWALLGNRAFALPWMLSGGLNPDNVAEAIVQTRASEVDVSSGVESAPGVKDPALIAAFIKAVRSA